MLASRNCRALISNDGDVFLKDTAFASRSGIALGRTDRSVTGALCFVCSLKVWIRSDGLRHWGAAIERSYRPPRPAQFLLAMNASGRKPVRNEGLQRRFSAAPAILMSPTRACPPRTRSRSAAARRSSGYASSEEHDALIGLGARLGRRVIEVLALCAPLGLAAIRRGRICWRATYDDDICSEERRHRSVTNSAAVSGV